MPDDRAQIVRFWHAVEMFSPQQLPKVDAKKHVADFRPGDPMPWEPGGKLRLARSGKVWRHVVFGGVYDLSKIRDVLVSKYGQDDPEAPTRGQSALFACTVDADGYLVEESAVLSACAWAIGQITQGKPILTGFREDALHYAEDPLSDTCGVFAVNGPPGTGKTTMLRDVIAAIVVNRAIELARLASPGEAFTTAREQWQPVQYSRTITTPNPKLTGFEILVASSNNGAVDNVSVDIPGPKGIGGQWRDAAATVDYFSQTAGQDAWAMIAARLGKRANRAAFVQDFWWNRDSGMQNVLRQTAAPRPDWQSAVTSFRRALSRVNDLTTERSLVSHSITRLPIASRDRAQADADLESARALREELETDQQDAAPSVVSMSSATETPGAMSRTSMSWLPASPPAPHPTSADLRSNHHPCR